MLSGKRKPLDYEKARLEEVQRHSRIDLESIRQTTKIQFELTALSTIGALSDSETLRLSNLRKQAREVNDLVGRALKLQIDLAALNVKAIANNGLSEVEMARRTVLRQNLEPIATEIRLADTRREETTENAVKRVETEKEVKAKRVEKLWKELGEHMRRRHITAKNLYRQFDESGSGELDYWDFFKGVQSIGIVFDEDDTDLLMADLDKEETGVVTLGAFSNKLKEQDPLRQQKLIMKAQRQEDRENRKKEKEADVGSMIFSFFGGTPPDEEDEEEIKTESEEEDEEEEQAANEASSTPLKGANVFESGTPVMAMHSTGDYFRATVVHDNIDGTCEVQFVLSTLGRDPALSKKKIRSLAQEEEVRNLWLEVSRAVGRRGAAELRSKSDFGGNISHDALIAWLESRDMVSISEHQKYVLLADIDQLHVGSVQAVRFLEKLEHFRARAKILGLTVFHRYDKEIAQGEDDEEEQEEEVKTSVEKKTATNAGVNGKAAPVATQMSAASQTRMAEIEALIFSMAKRQQELALALSASEVPPLNNTHYFFMSVY